MIGIDWACQIEGWMSPEELGWLHRNAAGKKLVVEVGSYLGRSTRALVDGGAELVVALDDWYGERQEETPAEVRAGLYARFEQNLFDKILAARLEAWRVGHWEESVIVAKLNGRRPDMVFIDGDHLYDNVEHDIRFWSGLLAPGGLLSGHDFFHDGVQRAVQERYAGRVQVTGSIWAVTC